MGDELALANDFVPSGRFATATLSDFRIERGAKGFAPETR
jgi:hypothetical protein